MAENQICQELHPTFLPNICLTIVEIQAQIKLGLVGRAAIGIALPSDEKSTAMTMDSGRTGDASPLLVTLEIIIILMLRA